MRLIAILLALWANHHPRSVERWRRPDPFLRYLDWIWDRLPASADNRGALRLAAGLLPPVLLFWLLQLWLDDWLLGIGEMLLGVWALVFLHGPGRVDDQVEEFLDAWREGRLDGARAAAARLADREVEAVGDAQLPATALEGLFWQSYRRLLGGIFWLLIIGPIGPVALRLAWLARDAAAERGGTDELARAADKVMHVLDWLPARAAALSFGLAGSFVHAFDGWRNSQEEPDAGLRELVTAAGLGALDVDRPPSDAEDVEDMLRDGRDLVGRSLMVWVAVAALLTIAGWLY